MDPAYIKKMPTEYYNGNESYFGGWSGFYNHYYNTMPKKEKQFGIPTVTKDPTIIMTTQKGMDVKEELKPTPYRKTTFNIMEGIEFRNFDC